MKWPFPFFRKRRSTGPRVVLHVGPWKTGTTAIQNVLLNAGDGIVYPQPQTDGPGHHRLAMQIDDPEAGTGDRNVLIQTVLQESSKGPGRPVVLSSESFSRAISHPLMQARLSEFADFFRTELVITHRRIEQKIHSLVQENVKNGWLHCFQGNEWDWNRIMELSAPEDVYIDRMIELGRWKSCHIVLIDPGRPFHIIDAFSEILGVTLPRTLDPAGANPAIPYMQLQVLLGLHRDNPGQDKQVLFERSRTIFSELEKSDPERAATPYPPMPAYVRRHYEASDVKIMRRILDLEKDGRVVVYRPKDV